MATIGNITSAVGGTGARRIAIDAGRCIEVRRHALTCHACVEACPTEAIAVEDGRIAIAPELCIGCGSCASVCPTQALRTASPSRERLIALVDQAADQVFCPASMSGDSPQQAESQPIPYLEFACEHAIPGNAGARSVVPGLPFADESVLVHAAARGFSRIVLTACNQPECLQPALDAATDAVDAARALLASAGIDCTIKLRRQKPAANDDAKNAPNNKRAVYQAAGTVEVANAEASAFTRRGMLSDLASQAGTIVAETANAEMQERLGARNGQSNVHPVVTDRHGSMEKFAVPRRESLLDDLYCLNPEPVGPIRVRGFARVEIAGQACTGCALCVRFCPTGALQGTAVPIGLPAAESHLSHRIGDCVGCRLCESACPLHCLHVHDDVNAPDIFELEPMELLAAAK